VTDPSQPTAPFAHHIQAAALDFGVDLIAILPTVVESNQGQLVVPLGQSGDQTRHHTFGTAAAKRVDDAGNFQGSDTVSLGDLVGKEQFANRRIDG
jgi:hypothetical protein